MNHPDPAAAPTSAPRPPDAPRTPGPPGRPGRPPEPAGAGARLGADDIAAALGLPPPTPEQRAVIEAPPESFLVVAGAGSGKTETMAARVVWLVAGGIVAPEDVLGLTFTKKAAAELAERIGLRLRRLRRVGLWTPTLWADGDDDPAAGAELVVGEPTVSTYDAYAGRLVRDHGLRVGVEPETRLLTDAAAWQYAHDVVARYDGPMGAVDAAESTVTAAVKDLAAQLAGHLRSPAELDAYLARLEETLTALPAGPRTRTGLGREGRSLLAHARGQRAIIPLVEAYLAAKRSADALDFGDRMALAAALAEGHPCVARGERARFRAVLLDEFQDTSEAQLRLLAALFADPAGGEPVPVTAVGDPHQAIYGWRGASSTTLAAFPHRFGAPGAPARVLPLSTSWRNDRRILAAANASAAPLTERSAVPVLRLVPSDQAGDGHVAAARLLTQADEAEYVADWVAERWWAPAAEPGERRERSGRSVAVLCRRRAQFAVLVEALQARGVPVEVVGLGGLLTTPEVADLVAVLAVVADPARSDQLMRLLTGPFVRLGVADVDALGAWSRHLHRRRTADDESGAEDPISNASESNKALDAGPGGVAGEAFGQASPRGARPAASAVDLDDASLVEALDELPPADWVGAEGQRLSPIARTRLRGLARVVAQLRSRSGAALPDLVGAAERALGLDIEVSARPDVPPEAARIHLDAFADVAARFAAAGDRPTLGGFLDWLEAARAEERGLDTPATQVAATAVQLLTVHAAKGLEWDDVAVPGLVEGAFPSHSSPQPRKGAGGLPVPTSRGWTGGLGGLPYDLRGDRRGLPTLPWASAPDAGALESLVGGFLVAGGEHDLAEERRLAYVAITRARHALLLTCSVWLADGARPRVPARFLTELLDGRGAPVPPPPRATSAGLRTPAEADSPAEPGGRAKPGTSAVGAPGLGLELGTWVGDPDPDEPNPALLTPPSATWPAPPDPRDPAIARLRAAADVVGAQGAAWDAGAALPVVPGPDDDRGRELDVLLTEWRADRARGRGRVGVALPGHLSTSDVVALHEDPAGFVLARRRPMPSPPPTAAREGSAFHAFVERHYRAATFVDPDDLPGSVDAEVGGLGGLTGVTAALDLDEARARFLASDWAGRRPVHLELPLETVLRGLPVRGRIDAVFARDGGGFTIVDWKTGPRPRGRRAASRALQLAVYRLAFCRWRGAAPDAVDAAFYYAATGETVYPDLPGEAELLALLADLTGPAPGAEAPGP